MYASSGEDQKCPAFELIKAYRKLTGVCMCVSENPESSWMGAVRMRNPPGAARMAKLIVTFRHSTYIYILVNFGFEGSDTFLTSMHT